MIAPICHSFLSLWIQQQNYKLIMRIIWLILLLTEDLLPIWTTSLIIELVLAMQYNCLPVYARSRDISFSAVLRVLRYLGNNPRQVILLSNWLLLWCGLGIECQFVSIHQLIFYHSWRLVYFLEVEKTGLHLLILRGSWVSLHERSCG